MSICPDHGGYTGDACKKCQTPAGGNAPIEAHRATKDFTVVLPKLADEDQFTLVKLESASLKAYHKMQNAQAQFQNFAQAMFEKYSVNSKVYTLDMEKLEFVPRAM